MVPIVIQFGYGQILIENALHSWQADWQTEGLTREPERLNASWFFHDWTKIRISGSGSSGFMGEN